MVKLRSGKSAATLAVHLRRQKAGRAQGTSMALMHQLMARNWAEVTGGTGVLLVNGEPVHLVNPWEKEAKAKEAFIKGTKPAKGVPHG